MKEKTLTLTVTTKESMKSNRPLNTRARSSYLVTVGDVGLITSRIQLKATINRRRTQKKGDGMFESMIVIVYIH